jgi:tripartite-type tricarboxylate transporter receptor subunit TctC
MRTPTRRAVLGAALGLSAAPPGRALAYPDRPVRLVVPWPPGAFTDVSARALAQVMTGTLGQPVVVENRAGASGSIGAEAVARAAPDGYTLLVGSAEPCAINALVNRRLPYDPVADFAPISLYAKVPAALAVGPSLREAADFDGFLDAVRAAPGRLTFGSWGIASVSHLTMEALNRAAGLRMLHVPFNGAAPAITAVAAGQVDAMFLLAGTAMGAARSGRVRILALAGDRRAAPMPGCRRCASAASRSRAATGSRCSAPRACRRPRCSASPPPWARRCAPPRSRICSAPRPPSRAPPRRTGCATSSPRIASAGAR